MSTTQENVEIATGSTPPADVNSIDSGHSYYLHASDYPSISIVSSVFNGKGYGRWRRGVVIALSAKNKLSFIDGTLKVPTTNPVLQKAWIDEIAVSVLYSRSAKDMWGDLEDRFGQTNGEKLFQFQKELNVLCKCDCGSKTKNLKAHQDERLLQFLMGLNDIFIGVMSNILLSFSLPNMGQAYSLVIQDEKQREIHVSPAYPSDAASFVADGNQSGGNRRFNEYRSYKGQGPYNHKKNTETCAYCKKIGHNIDRCYKIHGFPEDFKFTKRKRNYPRAQANIVIHLTGENEKARSSAANPQTLTQENIRQLL
ncbi:uncharacterized protein LOC132039425 [Lycium ferocissimum]|uniref:uncharacterized protein LOC132039425 n=1 Tax=Lycium ferocissimum TaxID=112874 RepID=UPI002814A98D|nr:uncharacterized protein LOC132039425 [Lycium ferocissimum]